MTSRETTRGRRRLKAGAEPDSGRTPRRRAKPKDLGDGVRRCAYGDCLAPLQQPNALYCHPEHARLAKIRVTLEARAEAAYRVTLEQALDPEAPSGPPPVRGWVVTRRGAVLAPEDLLELRAAWSGLTGALLAVDQKFRDRRPMVEVADLLDRMRRSAVAIDEMLERVTGSRRLDTR